MDPSGRFIRIDTITQVVNPVTLELVEEGNAVELPVCPHSIPLPDVFDAVAAADVPGLAPQTSCGDTRSWSRQLFQTDVGMVVTSYDRMTAESKIHWLQGTVVLTLDA